MRITDYIHEATGHEKKVALEEGKVRSWLTTISAFSNGKGGALVFRADDDDNLVGLPNAQHVLEKASENIKAQMEPFPAIYAAIHEEEEKQFAILRVEGGEHTPYYCVGREAT